MIDYGTFGLASAQTYFPSENVNQFGDESAKTLWRAAIDVQWFANEDAREYLERLYVTLDTYRNGRGALPITVTQDSFSYDSRSYVVDSGYIGMLLVADPEQARTYHEKNLSELFGRGKAPFGVKSSSLQETGAWFGHALYHGTFRNLLEDDYTP